MKTKIFFLLTFILLGDLKLTAAASDYAVVVSTATAQDKGWARVVTTLKKKHHATVISFPDVFGADSSNALRVLQPRYVAFVAKPQEIDAEFVRHIHLLSRAMDDDPYDDFIWGIVSGATPDVALRIAKISEPLIVRRALSTTGIDAVPLNECLTISDAKKGDFLLKTNGAVFHGSATNDSSPAYEKFLDFYNHHDVDLLVTSAHATEANLEMPFSDGSVIISGDKMAVGSYAQLKSYVKATRGSLTNAPWYDNPASAQNRAAWFATNALSELRHTTNPKIYIAAGNCLIGNALNSTDSLVMDWLSYQGVDQFVGYTVPTWFGKGGWGTLELWQDYGGQYNLAEAFFLNNQRIIHKLQTDAPSLANLSLNLKTLNCIAEETPGSTPQLDDLDNALKNFPENERDDLKGYLFDRDVVAFYGDPKWDAREDAKKSDAPISWHWSGKPGKRELEIVCKKDFKKSELIILLPERAKNLSLTTDAGLNAWLNDEFVWIDHPNFVAGKTYRLQLNGIKVAQK